MWGYRWRSQVFLLGEARRCLGGGALGRALRLHLGGAGLPGVCGTGKVHLSEAGALGSLRSSSSGIEGASGDLHRGVWGSFGFFKCHPGHTRRMKSWGKRVEVRRTMKRPALEFRQEMLGVWPRAMAVGTGMRRRWLKRMGGRWGRKESAE